MTFDNHDFLLTDAQLLALNTYFTDRAAAYAAAGEDPPSGVTVEFGFENGGLNRRIVEARFDGAVDPFVVDWGESETEPE